MSHKVMVQRCNQCLYGPDKIVSNARKKEIITACVRKDIDFLCHKGTIARTDIVCAGHLEATGGGQLTRIMGRLGVIQYIDPATMAAMPATPNDGAA